ncbi:hypothetical protein COLO4_38504 [Corchorus olitorius]|uniref:Uncharacterized protein n=1 Tax=Corchorus olitorius TaxID=93759 RepID=A0A1R3FUM8_9ROSI|nr:hypothetical protein COLO4_38504 [Corchorus olitorius]
MIVKLCRNNPHGSLISNLASNLQDQARNPIDLALIEPRFPFPISDSSRPMGLVFEYVIPHPSLYQTPLTNLRSNPSNAGDTRLENPKPSNPGGNPNSNNFLTPLFVLPKPQTN